jgi:TonB family protein
MTYPVRPMMDRRRSSMSFGASSCIHGTLLAWLVIASAQTPREVRRNLYDQEIRPYENHIVWYNLREKLPDIKPAPTAAAAPAPKRPRARRKFHQTLVSGPKDNAQAPQTIVTEAPPAELPKPLPLPNVVAEAAPPPPPRAFTPPPEAPPVEAPLPALPDAPGVEAKPPAVASPLEASTPRPRPRPFEPPPDKNAATAEAPPPELPEAPRVAAGQPAAAASPLGVTAVRPRPLPFQAPPPLVRPRTAAPLTLPEAPRVEAAGSPGRITLPGSATPRPRPRAFQGPPPLPSAAPRTSLVLPEAPAPAAPLSAASAPSAPRIPHGFSPPPAKRAAQESAPAIANPAPAVTRPGASGTESFAIAGLDPSKFTGIPAPPASHAAGFSGGPEVHPDPGGAASNDKAGLVVPGLTAGGGVRDSLPTVAPAPEASARSRLLAELRSPVSPHPLAPYNPNAPKALRVSSAPDPRLEGRVIYTMAIQMPNVTSHSGSWMVWFAERIPEPGAPLATVRPPVPLHKVDPAYIRSAVDDRVEGDVKLAAVIGKDGRVDRIEILSGIDARLDHSAEEALGKWLFEPALRDGAPVDVDAVFEVPFRLAPKPTR